VNPLGKLRAGLEVNPYGFVQGFDESLAGQANPYKNRS